MILVTGATGNVGRHVLDLLVAAALHEDEDDPLSGCIRQPKADLGVVGGDRPVLDLRVIVDVPGRALARPGIGPSVSPGNDGGGSTRTRREAR